MRMNLGRIQRVHPAVTVGQRMTAMRLPRYWVDADGKSHIFILMHTTECRAAAAARCSRFQSEFDIP
jgi:hypothetical protein